jgi:hypothetical protein
MLKDVVYTTYAATKNLPYIVLSYFRQAELDNEQVSQKFAISSSVFAAFFLAMSSSPLDYKRKIL